MTLQELFHKCAYENDWQVAGKDTDYKFVEDNDTLYIYFKGSDSGFDWTMNFWFTKKIYKEFRVHRGFYKEYSDVRDIILDKCYSKDYKNIIVVGYSLGGGLCQLAHEDIVYHLPNVNVHSYAFESPRCLKVSKKYKDRWKDLVVIRNGCDIVTHCPPKIFGYTDLGTMIKIKGDVSLVNKRTPKCIKYHYPQCVEDGLANRFNK